MLCSNNFIKFKTSNEEYKVLIRQPELEYIPYEIDRQEDNVVIYF